jgi:putative peptidoglycan lipid II flippase
MSGNEHHQLLRGFWVTSLGTLLSRVLGLFRDIATASLFGLEGGALDALVLALRIPNLFRRLFGEGALAACYLPVLAHESRRGQREAWQFVSTLLARLALVLVAIVAAGEILCAAAFWLVADEQNRLLIGLSATVLPYLLFICLAAQLAATLQAFNRFTVAGLAPGLLNVFWLVAVLIVCPRLSTQPQQAYALAICVLISGILQAAVQLPALWRLGFKFEYRPAKTRPAMHAVTLALSPMLAGLAVTQVNMLFDSLLAWSLTAPQAGQHAMAWFGGIVNYPLQPGATAAIYFAERFYQLPVGLLGVAIATVVFPRFSRHAAASDRVMLAKELTMSLRVVWFATIPASVGLAVLARPLARLLFQHGEFGSQDSARAAMMIASYSLAVWAYCALPVIVRGFYALSDQTRPVRIALRVVLINIILDVSLVWLIGEVGLAISTAASAIIQVAELLVTFHRSHAALPWSDVRSSLAKTVILSALMGVTVILTLQWLADPATAFALAIQLLVAVTVGIGVYATGALLLGMPELDELLPWRPALSLPRWLRQVL